MAFVIWLWDFVMHIDVHLGAIIASYGLWSYAILFLIIFAETGLVFTPFLPGDSLMFAAGAFAAIGSFNVVALFLVMWLAAVLGDTVNYWIGYFLGQKIVDNPRIPINQNHINQTNEFYAKHGGKTIFLARFIPIVRTFAPFVAGIGKMDYRRFITYNISGGLVWVFGFVFLGYFFGNFPFVKENFSLLIIIIILSSVVPIIWGMINSWRKKNKK